MQTFLATVLVIAILMSLMAVGVVVRAFEGEGDVVDPWGTTYAIECRGDDIVVTSAGPDRAFGTADDISS